MGGAVFGDHQDRHAEEKKVTLAYTVTLLVSMSGARTGFYTPTPMPTLPTKVAFR